MKLSILALFLAAASVVPSPARAATADLTLRQGAMARFESQDTCARTTVDISVSEQRAKTIPGEPTAPPVRLASISLVEDPLSAVDGCSGQTRNVSKTIINPTFTLDIQLARARLSGSEVLEDSGVQVPVTFDVTWTKAGPVLPNLRYEKQDLGDSIAHVLFWGAQRPANASGTLFEGSKNHTPTTASSPNASLFRDLSATVTVQQK